MIVHETKEQVMTRILIVDDYPMIRQVLDLLLNSVAGMTVVGHASNGLEAVALCEEQQPDIVLMDVSMPEMDGITATGVIRRRFPDIKIIMLTSMNTDELIPAAYEAGAHGFLQKNTTMSEIIDAVRNATA
jgi:two-component system, NarL family, response regulator LiaR